MHKKFVYTINFYYYTLKIALSYLIIGEVFNHKTFSTICQQCLECQRRAFYIDIDAYLKYTKSSVDSSLNSPLNVLTYSPSVKIV